MADAPPGVDLSAFSSWNVIDLRTKLIEFGLPSIGLKHELVERLQGYCKKTGTILNRPALISDAIDGEDLLSSETMDTEHQHMLQVHQQNLQTQQVMQQQATMFSSPLMTSISSGQVVDHGPKGDVSSQGDGMSEEEKLKVAQQQAALVLQQEREQQKEKELLEQQRRAAALLEQERQQEMMRKQLVPLTVAPSVPQSPALGPRGPVPSMPVISTSTLSQTSSLSSVPSRPQGPPPPPGDENRQTDEGPSLRLEPRIPQALERVLQYKEIRQEEVAKMADPAPEDESHLKVPKVVDLAGVADDDDEEVGEREDDDGEDEEQRRQEFPSVPTTVTVKESKNRRKKNKKKRRKKKQQEQSKESGRERKDDEDHDKDYIEIEYVTEEPEIYDPHFIHFRKIFQAFKLSEDVKKDKEKEMEKKNLEADIAALKKKKEPEKEKDSDDDDDDDDDSDDMDSQVPKLSKKKLRRINRMSVAELKQLVARPDVVEMHDVTAHDPKLLVLLKSTRNTVPVPRHWCFKRKYLQGKRGIEKPPFDLPEFIKRTGIMEMRQALQEKEDQKTLKSKMREKVRPKLGKIDIDYQKLHDAFFKWQTKPKMTIHGDLYYEGKEFETRLKEKKPGDLSDELRSALGMPVGANSFKVPPPWLIAMQRYGPPPSYPNLKVPGLNCPIPEGCSFGYHAGGWGKPPVDEMGRPLYGDVFGTNAQEFQAKIEEEEVDRTPWGELEPSDEEESSEEEEDSDEENPDDTGFITPADSGLVTPGGFASVPAGMETPELIELRKKKIEEGIDGGDTPQLYVPLPEKKIGVGVAMMGSAHIYDMSVVVSKKGPGPEVQGVEVALAPEELEMDPMAMTQKYEERVREQQAQVEKEDFSDMVAEHAAKQKQKKRKAQAQDSNKTTKKYKEFKF
uniref:splicing factor 3B subunit 2 isoform X1 n=2 Tax=Myxine glutinosa TaxID=7769 RepID=UPI00358FB238